MPTPLPQTEPDQTSGSCRARRAAAVAIVLSLFLVAGLPLILSGNLNGRGAHDQINYHEPVIRTFAAAWPRVDVSDYLSATTPGYHLLLAGIARFLTDSTAGLQLAGAFFTAGLLGTLAWALARRTSLWTGIALCLPMLGSMYVFFSGVWLLPDNLGWWGVLGMLLLALRPQVNRRSLLAAAILLVALVLVRQIHLWAAAPLWAAAWLGQEPTDPGIRTSFRDLFPHLGQRFARLSLALLATLPAVGVLAFFIELWGGLTPPFFQGKYHGGNPAAPALILTLLGGFSLFFLGYLAHPLAQLWREGRHWLLLAGLAGCVVAAIPATSYSVDAGRYSGMWNVVRALDARGLLIAGRSSPLIVAFSTLGAVVLLAWGKALPHRPRWIMLAAFAAFTAGQAASHEAWQRYSEPFVLMSLALMAAVSARACAHDAGRTQALLARLAPLGPAALGLLYAALTAVIIARATPATLMDLSKPHSRLDSSPGVEHGYALLPAEADGAGEKPPFQRPRWPAHPPAP